MGASRLSWLASGFYLVSWFNIGLATQLRPIGSLEPHAPHESHNGKLATRDEDLSPLELHKRETFLWAGSQTGGKPLLGNLTIHTPGETEHIISMEKFHPMLKSTQCTDHGMVLTFENERSFGYALDNWHWVNLADEHNFTVILGDRHCGWNIDRVPFVVSNTEWDYPSNTLTLVGHVSDWENAVHTFELNVGHHPGLVKRFGDWHWDSSTTSLSLGIPIPFPNAKIPFDGVELDLACEGCQTQGGIDFELHLEVELVEPKSLTLDITPSFSALFDPSLTLTADIQEKVESDPIDLGTFPLDPISLGSFANIGPEIELSASSTLGPLTGSLTIGSSYSYSLSGGSITIDLLNQDVSGMDKLESTFTSDPFTFSSTLQGSEQINMKAAAALSFHVWRYGFEANINLEPYMGASASISVSDSDSGNCKEEKGHDALVIKPSGGINLNLEAESVDDQGNPLWSYAIASVTYAMESICTAWGGDSGETTTTTTSASSSTFSTPPPSSSPTYSATPTSSYVPYYSTPVSSTPEVYSTPEVSTPPDVPTTTSSSSSSSAPYYYRKRRIDGHI